VSALVSIPVGVVVERRKAVGQWGDFVWRPVAVLPGEPDTKPWTVLKEDDERTSFYAGPAKVEFYRTETSHYRENLAADAQLWVVLRPTETEPAYEVAAVTADPFEGEGYTQAGDDIVEPVPMPETIRDMLEAFVAEHHVERTFFKRKRDRANKEALGRRGRVSEDDR
jgi:hypothetical protein